MNIQIHLHILVEMADAVEHSRSARPAYEGGNSVSALPIGWALLTTYSFLEPRGNIMKIKNELIDPTCMQEHLAPK